MSRGRTKSELVARKDGKTYPILLDYEIRAFFGDEEAGAATDKYSEWLVLGQKVPPDGEYTRRPHLVRGAEQVHVIGGRMQPGWLAVSGK